LDPEGLYDPERRATVESTLPPLDCFALAHAAAESKARLIQKIFMAGFLAIILIGILFVVLKPPPDESPVNNKPAVKAKPGDFMPPERKR
jgi:hypothetical protein